MLPPTGPIRKLLIVVVLSFFALALSLARQNHPTVPKRSENLKFAYLKAEQLYQQAEKQAGNPGFTDEQEEAMNEKALAGFSHVIELLKNSGEYDSLAFYAYLKAGILQHYFGNLPAAKDAYLGSIKALKKSGQLADSLLFKPALYLGSIYYLQDQFDSAMLSYQQAEHVVSHYQVPLTESERLYNTFGNIYLSTGNYKLAKNYFEKAIAALPVSNPYYTALLVNYKINLATSLTKLARFHEADSIYQMLLPYHTNTNEILHNSGIINLIAGNYTQSLSLFYQVKYQGEAQVKIFNDMATAWSRLGKYDSALIYFQKSLMVNEQYNLNRKNTAHGATLKEMGDMLTTEKKYQQAVESYQQAIIQFEPSFNTMGIETNPGSFHGIFSYINLFDAIVGKANALKELGNGHDEKALLFQALSAYRAAFDLIEYVERTYDSDEARIFLNKSKYVLHHSPIAVCLRLYDLTKDADYQQQAYQFDQRNKASILTLNVQENALKAEDRGLHPIFSRQAMLKASITRLSLLGLQLTDTSHARKLNDEIREYEIGLSKIQDTINTDVLFSRFRTSDKFLSVATIQQTILDRKTALISYHISDNELAIFCITRASFSVRRLSTDSSFWKQIVLLTDNLHDLSEEKKYSGLKSAGALYQKLVLPVYDQLKTIERLIIIPEDEINYIPFEALQNADGNYLIKQFAVQYQFAAGLIQNHSVNDHAINETLAMAPFTATGYRDTISGQSFGILKNSLLEVKDLSGKILTGEGATKQQFLQYANHYGVIHLATHASLNEEDPGKSFIAFYPDSKDHLLYASEIYNLNLDSTALVILSACETGSGKLVRGEGLMSLSRAVAYAGCANIITSLWKAEDQSTTYVVRQVHYYLQKGFTRDKALQRAKIDLLEDRSLPVRFKSPNYWANLILIDNYQAEKTSWYGRWLAGLGVFLVTIMVWILRKKTWLEKAR